MGTKWTFPKQIKVYFDSLNFQYLSYLSYLNQYYIQLYNSFHFPF